MSRNIRSVYIGGGTPSMLNGKQLASIIENINITDAEVTIEANPESLTVQKLIEYKKAGVNRISIGLQAWQDKLLESMKRPHTQSQFLNAFKLARNAGFTNINVDLIFGYTQQTMSDWQESLSQVIALKPEHISCYSLEIDNTSVLGNLIRMKRVQMPDEDLDRSMYRVACEMLDSAGYNHYEISNFARTGFECRHNIDFWNHGEYIGLGAGAHSFFNNEHFHHQENIQMYISHPLVRISDGLLTEDTARLEWLLLRLRLLSGFTFKDYADTFNSDFPDDFNEVLHELREKSLLRIDSERVFCTKKGMDLYNQIIHHVSRA